MPSTSKKKHNFMAAIANNPSFAKKAGVPQSVGKDFSAADKGRKFQKGGATMMGKKIPGVMADMMARRRPRMGAGMAPSAPPAPMGMKKGGKVRRFEAGGLSKAAEDWLGGADRTDPHILERMKSAVPDWKTGPQQDPAPVEDKKPTPVAQSVPKVEGRDTYGNDFPDGDVGGGRTTDFKAIPKAVPQVDSKTAPSKPKSLASRVNQGDVRRSEPSKPTSLASRVNQGDVRRSEPEPITKSETNAGAVTGRTFRRAPMVDINSEQYEQNRDRLLEVGSAVLPIPGVGAAVVGLRGAGKLGRYGAAEMRMLEKTAEPKLLTGPANVKRLTAPPKRITKETAAERKAAAEDAVYDARRSSDMEAMHKKGGAVKKFARGGLMKFSKDGMHKMPDGKMMKNSDMKKGGMAKYAEGGKVRRFKAGGVSEGQNPNIDDATRARALAFVNKPKGGNTQSFGAAFAAARKAGDSTFVWKGDKFTTKIDEEKKTPPPKPAAPSNKDARDRKLDDSGTSLNAYRGMAADEQAALRKRAPMKADVRGLPDYTENMDARDLKTIYGRNPTPEYEKEFNRTGAPPRVNEEGNMMDVPEFAKGGAMKKGGMPMKDGKPAFMMGKKMNMGGMAKYAKGGGIESRGKTKGTIIRMAAGGSVGSASRRADGIAQRGKTRG